MASGNELQRLESINQLIDQWIPEARLDRRAVAGVDGDGSTIRPFDDIVDSEYLIQVARMLRQQGRKAPGLDGIRWEDISQSDLCSLMRELSTELKAGGYYPSKARVVRRAKADGGHREITIRSIIHRVVAKAIQLALQPYFEKRFLPGAFGSRNGLGTWNLLLAMEAELTSGNNTVVFQGDIRKAFDYVPIAAVMECYGRYIDDEPLLKLIEQNLRGTRLEQRTVGIDQGAADSALALRVLLHENVDLLYDNGKHPRLFSYVDNYYGAASSKEMAIEALRYADGLLRPLGMALKEQTDASVVDLATGKPAIMLGFEIYLEAGRVRYEVSAASRRKLQGSLLDTHQYPNSLNLAIKVVQGWLQHFGPVYETPGQADEVIAVVRAACRAAGFREFPWSELNKTIEMSLARWKKLRAKVSDRPLEVGRAAALATPVDQKAQEPLERLPEACLAPLAGIAAVSGQDPALPW